MLAEHREWARLYAPEVRRLAAGAGGAAARRRPDRLRVGYVSPDFVNHAVAFFIEPVLAQHDRDRFEIFCYSDALAPDAVTRRLRSHPVQWRDIARASDEQVEALVRGDGIDLLVDLAGHTARHRLAVFAQRPAPVQVSWLGYPNTTGLAAIDYRLTEAVSDPPDGPSAGTRKSWCACPRDLFLPPAAARTPRRRWGRSRPWRSDT